MARKKKHKREHKYIVFIDFETTGIDPAFHHPIQIGAIALLFPELEYRSSYVSYIKPPPRARNDDSAFRTHGIKLETITDAPTPKEVVKDFFETFGTDYCFGGWNVGFDLSFFKKLCDIGGMTNALRAVDYHSIDVQSLSKILNHSGLIECGPSLNSALNLFGIHRAETHDALEDAKITAEVYKNFIDIIKTKVGIQGAFKRTIDNRLFPDLYKKASINNAVISDKKAGGLNFAHTTYTTNESKVYICTDPKITLIERSDGIWLAWIGWPHEKRDAPHVAKAYEADDAVKEITND